jgi:hypothetical protein
MSETVKKPKINVELNLLGIILLYLVAVLAGSVNLFLGIVAFICFTLLIFSLVWLAKETTS